MRSGRKPAVVGVTLFACALGGCGTDAPELVVRPEASPIAGESQSPQLTPFSDGRVLLSWGRPLPDGGYAFEMALRGGWEWSDVRRIAEGSDLSMFPTDLPAVATLGDSRLFAYWIARDEGFNATRIETAVSSDEGRTWAPTPTPYEKALPAQHSFISWLPTADGIGLVWLDATVRSQVHARSAEADPDEPHTLGSVGLRYSALNTEGGIEHEEVVDPITCECCPTSAASTSRGPVIVYRDRQEAPGTLPTDVVSTRPTVRDIYLMRQEDGVWREPTRVHEDNWVVNVCPDNGPAVDASGSAVAVAWWTASDNQFKVQVAFSSDSGDSFGPAHRVDLESGEGQVTVALLPNGRSAIVGWLEGGQTWARYVSDDGARSRPVALGPSPFHSRLPHWLANGDGSVTVAWTSLRDGSPRVEISRIELQHAG